MRLKRYGIILSFAATLSMVLTYLPVTAYATENDIAVAGESAALMGEDVSANAVKELKKVEISNADDLIYLSQKSTAEAYSFGAELSCLLCVMRCIRIGTNLECPVFIGPAHDPSEFACDLSIYCGHCSVIDISCGPVEGYYISLMIFLAGQGELLILFIHYDVAAA